MTSCLRFLVQTQICALMLALGVQIAQAQSDVLDQILVTVDGSPITESEVERRINWLRFLASNSGDTSFSIERARRQAIDDAIVSQLQRKRAGEMGLFLSDSEIDERIASVIEVNNVSPDRFFADLTANGIGQDEFRQSVVESLLNDKLTERLVIPRIRIRDEEIDRYLAANPQEFAPVEEYDLSVIVISETLSMNFEQKQVLRQIAQDIKRELDSGSDFDEIAALASRFEGIQAGNLGWVQRENLEPALAGALSGSRVSRALGPVVSGSNTFFALVRQYRKSRIPDLPELREFHLARLVMQAQNEAGAEVNAERLEELRTTILNGADFGEIARVYSHDDTTRKQGGDLGWIPEDSMPFEYFGPLSELSVGDISPVQRIGNIVFVLSFRDVREASQEQRQRSLVRNQLRNFRLRNERANWIDELRESAVIDYRATF